MTEEADEVKVFRVHDEDESDAPSLADDKKDVAMEEEMESKPFFGGEGAAFKPAMASSSPSFASLLPYQPSSPFYGGVIPFQYALMNQAASAALAAQAAHQYIRTLSPCFNVPLPASPLDMYRNALIAAASPNSGPKVGMMGVPLPPSQRPNPLNQIQMMGGHLPSLGGASTSSSTHPPKKSKKEKEEHIKKPMNAFMWYMKENRPKIMEEMEWKDKQSAELNKELGFRWQKLGKDEQKKYYDMAIKDKEEHLKRYPNWSARENYASSKKKKKKRDRTIESGESKKCRARFGMQATDKWCKHCSRKKKCLYTRDEEERANSANHGASDSESDLDEDPTTLSMRDLDDDTNRVKMEVGDPPSLTASTFGFNPMILQQ